MSKNPLEGRVVIVTGGGRGMGRAMALGFARAGAAGVAVTSAGSPDETAAVAREIDAIAGRPAGMALTADVGDAAACARAVEAVVARFGALHILMSNAGKGMRHVGESRGAFWKADSAGWDSVIATNVNGPFHMAKPAVPHMIAAGWGRIVNISKTIDSMHEVGNSPYGCSKAAVDAMTMSWAQDLEGTGVTANLLAPGGLVNTTFSRANAITRARDTGKKLFEAEDIVPAAVWLASEDSASYTGCRFNAARWDDKLPPSEAGALAHERPIFPAPGRSNKLAAAWNVRSAVQA
ncbi:MAG TPA: SDR family oxidoreductase [Alphaproteobacteria bacterium]|jgi:3-oxoacyl-[acyl-carrier protein] reductase